MTRFQSSLLPFDLPALWTALLWPTNGLWSRAFEKLHSFDFPLLLTSGFFIHPLFNPASSSILNFGLALWVLFPGQLLSMNQPDSWMHSVGWQFYIWDECISVMIPKRFKSTLHSVCDQVLRSGDLFSHDYIMHYIPPIWQVTINAVFPFGYLLHPPSISK